MSVTSVEKDLDSLTLTLTADFDSPIARVWQLWADPRQLERWWGPPTYPATVEKHDLTPGGDVTYVMTGPEGDKSRGFWRITEVDPPTSLAFVDGFANQDGTAAAMPTMEVQMQLTEHGGGTRMQMRSTFASREHMEQLLGMGLEEGVRGSVGQMDDLLAAQG